MLGCLPSIRFVPKVTAEEDNPETIKVMIKTVAGMREELMKVSGGEPEEALHHVLFFHQTECWKYPGRIQAKLSHAQDPTSDTMSGLHPTSAARLQIADGLTSQYGGSNSAQYLIKVLARSSRHIANRSNKVVPMGTTA